MSSIPETRKSLLKLAQIYYALRNSFTLQNIEKLISKEGNINHKVPSHSFLTTVDPELAGGTALHIALSHRKIQVLDLLLNAGADYTIKNNDGSTPLHYIATTDFYRFSDEDRLEIKPLIDAILSHHVKSKNSVNPRDTEGLSHLHIACMVNHVDAVKFFLDNGEDVNQTTNFDEPSNPGYTQLHFAVKCYNIETVKTLLDYGASVYLKNGERMTALHLLLSHKIDDCMTIMDIGLDDRLKTSIFDNIKDNEDYIDLILEKIPRDKFIIDDTGLSRFHIACTAQDTSTVESILEKVDDINHSAFPNSFYWPGYTGLHFAAECNTNTVKILLTRGADLEVKNERGVSPFDICLRRCEVKDIHSIVSHKPEWKDTLLSGGKVRLSDLLYAMENVNRLKSLMQSGQLYINACVPANSKLWPGYTPLHLAVTLTERHSGLSEPTLDLVRECLSDGADVTIKDSHGRTPLNLAFREDKKRVIELLLHCHHVLANPTDEDNLSHLHIACEAQNEVLVENLLTRTGDVDIVYNGSSWVRSIKPGSTPLHIAVAKKNLKLVDILMRHGANVNIANHDGHTPIHEIFHLFDGRALAKRLFSSLTLQERVVDGQGLSHLHLASFTKEVDVVERLLRLGANVDSAYKGMTPLRVAVGCKAFDVIVRLLEHGADILARSDMGSTPLSIALGPGYKKCFRLLLPILKNDQDLQARLERETGMSMLHLACHSVDVDEVKSLLVKGANVNARVNEKFEIWAGCTPLHVLSLKELKCVRKFKEELHEKIITVTEILLDAGADVTLLDARGKTPIHIAFKLDEMPTRYTRVRQLLSYQTNFDANPINAKGFSHFHLACMVNDPVSVEKFLLRGSNANEPIDFFIDKYPGYYPIHLAIDAQRGGLELFEIAAKLKTVELLLKYGADVRAENIHGHTALHDAARLWNDTRKRIMEMILSAGADVNHETMSGETPLEALLSMKDTIEAEEIQVLVEHKARINSYNSNNDIGYMSMLLSKHHQQTAAFEEMMKSPDIAIVDETGRSAMHNVVTTANPNISSQDYVRLFEKFASLGCDVDGRDKFGYTALHLASQFGNKEATLALLTFGADMNVVDLTNKSAFSNAIENCRRCHKAIHRHNDVIETLALHLQKLQLLGLDVSPLNANLKESQACPRVDVDAEFHEQVDVAKKLEIAQTSFVAADFLRETKAVIDYSYLSSRERNAIDEFFDSIDGRGIEQLRGILKLQYRKAVDRFSLVEAAVEALRSLLGFPLPELCCVVVFRFLRNADLRGLIEAAGDDD